jgi:signal transduction histidine kinase
VTPAAASSEEFLDRLGVRYAAALRAVVGLAMAAIAPLAGPPAGLAVAVAVSVAVAVWSVTYLRLMSRTPRRRYWCADVAVLCVLGAAQPWLVDPRLVLEFVGWVAVVTSFGVVALQWHVRAAPATAATLLVVGCTVAGAAATSGVTWQQALVPTGAWILVEALLSRMLWTVVRRAARAADAAAAERAAAQQRLAADVARREDQRLHWAAVHDTAASTLLMVGAGVVRGDEPWLREQLSRDLAAVSGEVPVTTAGRSLPEVLEDVAARSLLRVDVDVDVAGAPAVPAHAADALAGAVREALENVRRHAGTGRAAVRASSRGGRVLVEVVDRGHGFDVDAVGPRHDGIALSMRDRMRRAGGTATVTSCHGRGTVVALEWPRA